MTKRNKLFLGAFGLIALGSYLVYRFVSKTKKGQNLSYPESVKEDVKAVTNTIKETVLPVASYPLKKGSKGSNVVVLQKWLNEKGYANPKLVTDGIFGEKTENAVKLVQDTPYEKTIDDYNKKVIWDKNYNFGEVSLDFFNKFIR